MTIKEAAAQTGLSTDTLRYYEKMKLLPTITRSSSGIRQYTPNDLQWILFIKCMRQAGISVPVLAQYVKLFLEGPQTTKQRKEILIEQHQLLQQRIKELTETLERLDYKIHHYEEMMSAFTLPLTKTE